MHARPVCRSELLVVDDLGLLLMLCLNHHALQKRIVRHYCSCSHMLIGDWSPCISLMHWWKVSEWAYALAEKIYPLMNYSVLLSVAQWSLCSGCCNSQSWPQRACRVRYAFSNWPLFATFVKLIGDLKCLIFGPPLISHCNFPRRFEPFDSCPSQIFVSGSSTWLFSLTSKKLDSMARYLNRLETMRTRGLVSNEIILKTISVVHTIAGNKICLDSDTVSLLID